MLLVRCERPFEDSVVGVGLAIGLEKFFTLFCSALSYREREGLTYVHGQLCQLIRGQRGDPVGQRPGELLLSLFELIFKLKDPAVKPLTRLRGDPSSQWQYRIIGLIEKIQQLVILTL